ncbi:hypothetical protein VIGAN_UM038800 [Vigna angularis var. angularis]|uniref:Uncharacterized protein n=1 Tax=Vigna angularis var. angularis TaxID=157739 RepID=A0A0S3TDY8_PHAAN|nr:hypothetical protein VIGAN_UM038800 [Vigna angularis var. angularis]
MQSAKPKLHSMINFKNKTFEPFIPFKEKVFKSPRKRKQSMRVWRLASFSRSPPSSHCPTLPYWNSLSIVFKSQ